jgi:hypothetical protein
MSSGDKVWIFDEQCVGTIMKHGSFFSLVTWYKDGIIYEEYLENTEYSAYEKVEDEKD